MTETQVKEWLDEVGKLQERISDLDKSITALEEERTAVYEHVPICGGNHLGNEISNPTYDKTVKLDKIGDQKQKIAEIRKERSLLVDKIVIKDTILKKMEADKIITQTERELIMFKFFNAMTYREILKYTDYKKVYQVSNEIVRIKKVIAERRKQWQKRK